MTQEEKYNLLKNACEEGLKHDPGILEGKKVVYTENSGKTWKNNNGAFHDFMIVPETEVRVCISQVLPNKYYIVISNNMKWVEAFKNITNKIKENNDNILTSVQLVYANTFVIVVMF